MHHTSWSATQGAPGQVFSIRQTSDGVLWLGSEKGLYSFDGVAFRKFVPTAPDEMPHESVFVIWPTASNGLWLGFRDGGIGLLEHGRVKVFGPKEGIAARDYIMVFAEESHGQLWALTDDKLLSFSEGRWRSIDVALPEPGKFWSMFIDRHDTMWLSTSRGAYYRMSGQKAFVPVAVEKLYASNITQSPDDRVWLTDPVGERGMLPLTVGGAPSIDKIKWLVTGRDTFRPIWDEQGCLWLGYQKGLQRLSPTSPSLKGSATDAYRTEMIGGAALSGTFVTTIHEDREHSIWVGTNGGIDRFRSNRLTPSKLPPDAAMMTIVPAAGHGMLATFWHQAVVYDLAKGSRQATIKSTGITTSARSPSGATYFVDKGFAVE